MTRPSKVRFTVARRVSLTFSIGCVSSPLSSLSLLPSRLSLKRNFPRPANAVQRIKLALPLAAPRLFPVMTAPTLMLWLFALAMSIATVLDPEGAGMPKRAEAVANIALPFILAWWVMADARKRGRPVCYDYDSFVYFAWPVMVPVYLFQTRGVRAFVTLLCFAGLWLVAAFVAAVLAVLRELASS